MFTGIIESIGEIIKIDTQGTNKTFLIRSAISNELKIDQSVAHNGVCLTVVQCNDTSHAVTAIDETLSKSNLGDLNIGDFVNLERCMKLDARLDGHMVYGHVDKTVVCTSIKEAQGSWIFTFAITEEDSLNIVEKGSITINGTSLTVFDVSMTNFSVAIIPYTYDHTTIQYLKVGQRVNIEFDILGKYVRKMLGK